MAERLCLFVQEGAIDACALLTAQTRTSPQCTALLSLATFGGRRFRRVVLPTSTRQKVTIEVLLTRGAVQGNSGASEAEHVSLPLPLPLSLSLSLTNAHMVIRSCVARCVGRRGEARHNLGTMRAQQ
jgi:hypothetical protein